MDELIKIDSFNYGDAPTVSGRELHKALEVKTPYTMWFERMCEYGFTENEDFRLVSQICETNNPKNPRTTIIDHLLTIDTAKEICMLQRTEIGRTIRKYFIETEKQYKQKSDSPALLQYVQSLESRIATLESKQATKKPLLTDADEKLKSEIEKFLDIPITEDWYYTSLEERKQYIKDYQNGTAIAGTYKRDHISVKEIACELLGYDLNQTISRRMSLKIARILIAIGLTKKTAKKWLCVYQAQWTYEK